MKDSPTLYKYRPWKESFHKSALYNNELYFASPEKINDPFDLKINHDFSLLESQFKREEYLDSLIMNGISGIIKRGLNPMQMREKLLWNLENDIDKMQRGFEDHFNSVTNKCFGVISLSETWSNILMWSHYTENHKGFCMGYNKEKLLKYEICGSNDHVKYLEEYPRLYPHVYNDEKMIYTEIITKTFSKSKVWCYEEEYRLLQLWEGAGAKENQRLIIVPNDFIDEIILGYAIEGKTKKEILSKAQEKDIPVFQIIRKPKTFLLDKIQIQ